MKGIKFYVSEKWKSTDSSIVRYVLAQKWPGIWPHFPVRVPVRFGKDSHKERRDRDRKTAAGCGQCRCGWIPLPRQYLDCPFVL